MLLVIFSKRFERENLVLHSRVELSLFSFPPVDGKVCYDCVIEEPPIPGEKCGDFKYPYTQNCHEKDDGFCIKYSKGDSTYFSCDEYGIVGQDCFTQFPLINIKNG